MLQICLGIHHLETVSAGLLGLGGELQDDVEDDEGECEPPFDAHSCPIIHACICVRI